MIPTGATVVVTDVLGADTVRKFPPAAEGTREFQDMKTKAPLSRRRGGPIVSAHRNLQESSSITKEPPCLTCLLHPRRSPTST